MKQVKLFGKGDSKTYAMEAALKAMRLHLAGIEAREGRGQYTNQCMRRKARALLWLEMKSKAPEEKG